MGEWRPFPTSHATTQTIICCLLFSLSHLLKGACLRSRGSRVGVHDVVRGTEGHLVTLEVMGTTTRRDEALAVSPPTVNAPPDTAVCQDQTAVPARC